MKSNKEAPQNDLKTVCPVCGKYSFDGIFDICNVCFWEHDPWQEDEPTSDGGSNRLCLNDYRNWWAKLNTVLPPLMEKYDIYVSPSAHWTYDSMIVPRHNIQAFLNELTEHNVEATLSFYNICEKYGYNRGSFVGYPYTYGETAEETNQKCLDIVFTDNPLKTCEQYELKQLSKLLRKSKTPTELWEELTPYVCIAPNPDYI